MFNPKDNVIMKNLNYVAPQVEEIEIAVEQGFATSGGGEGGNWEED
jgi:hypothetical protein